MCECRKLTFTVTVEFLHERFARYGVPNTIVSDTQLNISQLPRITQDPTKKRERFVDIFKISFTKARNELVDGAVLTHS